MRHVKKTRPNVRLLPISYFYFLILRKNNLSFVKYVHIILYIGVYVFFVACLMIIIVLAILNARRVLNTSVAPNLEEGDKS